MHFERTTDTELVRRVITAHPKLYDCMADDFSAPIEEYRPLDDPAIWYVLAIEASELLGLFAFFPHNAICWEVHTALLPGIGHARARQAGRGVIAWVFANTLCKRIVTEVPKFNFLALRYARDCGLRDYGLNQDSYMKHGTLHHLALLGISASEVPSCR